MERSDGRYHFCETFYFGGVGLFRIIEYKAPLVYILSGLGRRAQFIVAVYKFTSMLLMNRYSPVELGVKSTPFLQPEISVEIRHRLQSVLGEGCLRVGTERNVSVPVPVPTWQDTCRDRRNRAWP